MPENAEPLLVGALLSRIRVGASVAEFDQSLADYFVRTSTFEALIGDTKDTVAGDKGTGKTALFKIILQQYEDFRELADVQIIAGFNASGEPAFQELVSAGELNEDRYNSVWKAYLLTIVGNWLLDHYEGGEELASLQTVLTDSALRLEGTGPLIALRSVLRALKIRSVESTTTYTPDGIPVFGAKVNLGEEPVPNPIKVLPHRDALAVLDRAIAACGVQLWLVLDRLDEAFQAHPEVERPALRALFRAYLDLQEFQTLRLKLFVRKDLFARIIEGGFVNLTHVNARKEEIVWEDADLFALLTSRLRESKEFRSLAGLEEATAQEVFSYVFPDQVDAGGGKPKTWNWMISRIRDGNDVKPPRNLIDLTLNAIAAQSRREAREPRPVESGVPLITGEAMKQALQQLSRDRIQDTLLAEAGDLAPIIQLFENGKAEHNDESLRRILGADWKNLLKRLRDLGFLEPIGQSYKVPALYRSGLGITNGKAFSTNEPDSDLED